VRYLPPFRLYLVISVLFFVVIGLGGGGGDEDDADLVKLDSPAEVARVKNLADQFAAKEFGAMTDAQSAQVAEQLRAFAAQQAAAIEAKQAPPHPAPQRPRMTTSTS
jgi:hypothetical protein